VIFFLKLMLEWEVEMMMMMMMMTVIIHLYWENWDNLVILKKKEKQNVVLESVLKRKLSKDPWLIPHPVAIWLTYGSMEYNMYVCNNLLNGRSFKVYFRPVLCIIFCAEMYVCIREVIVMMV
jgi:hypothetical protein